MSTPHSDTSAPGEAPGDAPSAQAPTLAQLMNLLSISPSSGSVRNSHAASVLRELYGAQSDVLHWLEGLGSRVEGEDGKTGGALTLVEIDSVLLRWLHAAYLHAASLLGLARSDHGRAPPPATPLAGLIASSGLLSPFISGVDPATGRINVGHPTNDEATCSSLSELLRVAGAALVTFTDYLSRPAISNRIPSDESALLFASLAIRSCLSPDVVETLAQELGELAAAHIWPGPGSSTTPASSAAAGGSEPSSSGSLASRSMPSSSSAEDTNTLASTRSESPPMPEFARFSTFSVAHIRWLMHWLRAQLSDQFGAVRFLLGDRVGHKECLVAAQQDKLVLLKLVPDSLVAYVLYCRACLQFQQTKAAFIFSSKGLVVAEALGDDAMRCQLLLINATASALGGSGPTFNYSDVVNKHAAALRARDASLAWLPSQLHPLLDLEPELGIITDKVIAAHAAQAAELSARGGGGDVSLPVLEALYTVPEPSYLPPGAVEQDQEEESASTEGGLSTIQEGDQDQAQGQAQGQGQGEGEGGQAPAAAAAAAATAAAAASSGSSGKVKLSGSSRAAKAARPNGHGKR